MQSEKKGELIYTLTFLTITNLIILFIICIVIFNSFIVLVTSTIIVMTYGFLLTVTDLFIDIKYSIINQIKR